MNVTKTQTPNERFAYLVEKIWRTQVAASQALSFSQPYLSQLIKGKREISKEVLQKIAAIAPHVNIDWVLTGDGEWSKIDDAVKTYQIGEQEVSVVSEESAGLGVLERLHEEVIMLKAGLRRLEDRMRAMEEERHCDQDA